jgi:hypothetical protein
VTQALKPCFCKKKPRAFYYAESKHKKNRETTGRTVAALFLLECGAPHKPNSAGGSFDRMGEDRLQKPANASGTLSKEIQPHGFWFFLAAKRTT